MKKILLATTMLVGTAGFAAAEVTLSGDARMGVISDFGDVDTAFTSRARVTFSLAGETDGGLAFGGSFRADNAVGASSGNAGSVFISGAFGKISMGDVDGAAKAAVGNVDGVGLTGLSDTNESLFIANGGFSNDDLFEAAFGEDAQLTGDPSVLYEYSTGSLSFYASVTNPGYTADLDEDEVTDIESDAYSLGVAYAMGDYRVSLGYEALDVGLAGTTDKVTVDHIILGGDATFGGVTVKARYGSADGGDLADGVEVDQYAISATYKMDALSATIFTNNIKAEAAGVDILEGQSLGLGASYDLGGGASIVGGVARVKDKLADESDTAYDLGLNFTF